MRSLFHTVLYESQHSKKGNKNEKRLGHTAKQQQQNTERRKMLQNERKANKTKRKQASKLFLRFSHKHTHIHICIFKLIVLCFFFLTYSLLAVSFVYFVALTFSG